MSDNMNDPYIEWRSQNNVCPIVFLNKEKYYHDLRNIENSWSGRMDAGNIGNTFIMEAEQLLINSIELFEKGYFDCAFYSIRAAIELSTTMVYLIDMPANERITLLDAWKSTRDFPMQGQMIQQLASHGDVFGDMKAKMPEFFAQAKQQLSNLNKYVHKQGLQNFYISRNHSRNHNLDRDVYTQEYESFLKKGISIVAVMRLALDPYPILLMDEEMLYRSYDSMTEPYSPKFVSEYLGEELVFAYSTTDIFQNAYNSHISEEKKNEAIFNITKHQYIDSTKRDEIIAQLHLMRKNDLVCTLLVLACEKIVKAYCFGGLLMFFTDRNTKRKSRSWAGADFKIFAESSEPINQRYDEAYISTFQYDSECYFIEHNELLDKSDLSILNELIANLFVNGSDQH
jgi:hypothetical protein